MTVAVVVSVEVWVGVEVMVAVLVGVVVTVGVGVRVGKNEKLGQFELSSQKMRMAAPAIKSTAAATMTQGALWAVCWRRR